MKYCLLVVICLFGGIKSFAQDTLTLVFAGDIMQHQGQIDAAKNGSGYDYSTYYEYVKKYIASADVAVANLEVPLAGKPYSGYPNFCAPDELAKATQEAGFDVLLTANNHSCDKGKKGVERTIEMLDSLKIAHTGTFLNQAERDRTSPLIVGKNNFRLAILNYTYGTNGIDTPEPTVVNLIDTAQIAFDVAAAKTLRPDVIIAAMHWGEEYKLHPNKEQERLADFLVRQGVQLIIGAHPHVLQRMERRYDADGKTTNVVVYSLGNYVSNMSAKNTTGGAMAHIRLIKEHGKVMIDECAYSLVWTYKPVIENRRRFYILPVADFENNPDYFSTPAEFKNMTEFAKNMRELYTKENIGFVETPLPASPVDTAPSSGFSSQGKPPFLASPRVERRYEEEM